MKIDFGTQVEGRIIDCAWTVYFDETFDPLAEAAREATNAGIRACGLYHTAHTHTHAYTWHHNTVEGLAHHLYCPITTHTNNIINYHDYYCYQKAST